MSSQSFILKLRCPDAIGIVAAITHTLKEMGGFIEESAQFSDPSTRLFFMRIVFHLQNHQLNEDEICQLLLPISEHFDMSWELHREDYKPKTLILVSKYSHCLSDILHRVADGNLPIEIAGIISNHPDLTQMAKWYSLPFHHLPVNASNKAQTEAEILKLIETLNIDLVVLARYMQILSKDFCSKMEGKIINIHHSFLPSFKGAKPYHQAHEHGVKVIGATAHYVTSDLDEGPIIEQEIAHVNHNHPPKKLVSIGRDIENLVLSRAILYHAEQRVILNEGKTIVFK